MCGRYAVTMDTETLFGVFDAAPDPTGPYGGDPIRPRYNIAPTTDNPVVRLRSVADAGLVRTIEPMRWGLVPSWAKDVSIGNRMFNARAETAATTASFRSALGKRRALVPVSGYYEWQKLGEGRKAAKQPFWITPQDGSVMALAGLWEYWRQGEERVLSYTILTTDAVGPMAQIHHRMPLILPAVEWESWLAEETEPEQISSLVQPPPLNLVEQLEFRPVGDAVGNVRNDTPDLLHRVEPKTDDEQPTLLD